MSKNNKVTPPETIDEQSADLIKEPVILQDNQLSKTTTDDIDEPSSVILPQQDLKISSDLAQDIIDRLATLSELEYELERTETAKSLNNMSVRSLDKLVKKVRNKIESETSESLIIDTEPYSEPVLDITSVADQICQILDDHIACKDAVKFAATLWILMTWLIPASHILPIAWINAPEKRCGKSTLLTLMSRLSKRSLPTSNITGPALFRSIESYKPTLFIDEVDTFINESEGLQGILNAGHSRDNPYIIRCVGDDNEPVPFNVYGAKAISGIGKIPGTLIDRSISLTLERKMKYETKQRVRYLPKNITNTIQSKLARWSDDNLQTVRDAKPVLPVTINDRAQDNWEILLKIAMILGDDWLEKAYRACIEISGIENDELSMSEQLLADIQTIFRLKGTDRILTEDLINSLCRDSEMQWSTYHNGKKITSRQISNLLSGFKIKPKSLRTKPKCGRGYELNHFSDAFIRYLP
jgi:putative DNA primase/helicase